MTDEISTIDVGSPSFGQGAGDGSQYIGDPFSGGDDIVLQSITEQVNGSINEPTELPEEETQDSETAEGRDSTEELQETTEEEAEVEQETTEESKEEPKTFYKLKIDGKEMSVPDNALVKVKVNGKSEYASVGELIADYNGRVAWAPRFSELGRKEKALEQREVEFVAKSNRVSRAFQEAGKALEEKNPLKAVLAISKAQGLNTKEQVANFLIQSDKSIKDWIGMSPESRQLLLDQIELAQHREEKEEMSKIQSEMKKGESWAEETYDLLMKNGVDPQDFIQTSRELIEKNPDKLTGDEVKDRQIVIDTVLEIKQKSEIEEVANKVNSSKFKSLDSKNREALVSKLLKYKSIGEWESREELEELLVGLLGKPALKTGTSLASQKAVGQLTKPVAPKGSLDNTQKPASTGSEDMLAQIFKEVMSSDI